MSEAPEPVARLVAIEPAGGAMVRIEAPLVQEHGAPWWVLPTRLALVVGAILLLPLQGVVLAPAPRGSAPRTR